MTKTLITFFSILLATSVLAQESKLNKELVQQLKTILKEDQNTRTKLDKLERRHGRDSQKVKDQWTLINHQDSINQTKVKAILDVNGWPGPDVVGMDGARAMFLVIQHSGKDVQEKYIPMMRDAAKNKRTNPAWLAMLEDRLALEQGKKQIYGSQIGIQPETGKRFVLPLEDPDNVDKRRQEVGLMPIADYVKKWELTWDVEQYKKDLPELEKVWRGN